MLATSWSLIVAFSSRFAYYFIPKSSLETIITFNNDNNVIITIIIINLISTRTFLRSTLPLLQTKIGVTEEQNSQIFNISFYLCITYYV